MTTTTERKLTPKQQRVMALLSEGLKPPTIAKRMKITNAGVYGHMRAMRKAGHVLPGEEIASNGSTAGTAFAAKLANSGTNGSEAEATLRAAVALCDEDISDGQNEVLGLEKKLAETRERLESRNAERTRYVNALNALLVE